MAIMPMMGLMMQSDSIRQLPEIHSRSPWSQSLRTTRRASPDLKEISSSASEKPSHQFGLEPSGDRPDIGYARSDVAVVNPGNSFSGWVRIRFDQPDIAIEPFTRIRALTRGIAICPWRKEQLIMP